MVAPKAFGGSGHPIKPSCFHENTLLGEVDVHFSQNQNKSAADARHFLRFRSFRFDKEPWPLTLGLVTSNSSRRSQRLQRKSYPFLALLWLDLLLPRFFGKNLSKTKRNGVFLLRTESEDRPNGRARERAAEPMVPMRLPDGHFFQTKRRVQKKEGHLYNHQKKTFRKTTLKTKTSTAAKASHAHSNLLSDFAPSKREQKQKERRSSVRFLGLND